MYNISPLLIKMFNASVYTDSDITENDIKAINEAAMKKGYLIDPSICDDNVMKFIDSINTDYNSTFYKTWQDIVSKDRLEIYLEQVLHYMTVALDVDNYIANPDFNNPEQPDFSNYKVIKAISANDMYTNCWDMITSGIALSSDVIIAVCDYIISYQKTYGNYIPVDDIVNKEANIYICDKLQVYPVDKFNLLRYLVYKFTGKFDLIKSDLTFESIKTGNVFKSVDLKKLDEYQLKGLASIYYRFKPLFLAMRYTSDDNKVVINKIRRMADKYKEPFYPGKLETLLNRVEQGCDDNYIRNVIESASNYKLVTLLQAINERIYLMNNDGYISYLIRNGKSFTTNNKYYGITTITDKESKYKNAYNIIKNQLLTNLSAKACVVKFSKSLNLTCPTSEKNFIGNLPMGSNFDMKESSFFGIYWRNDWGARDFDLSFTSEQGCKIGWDSWYKHDGDTAFSGDVINAPEGANEVLYFKKGCPNGTINVNRYTGNPFAKFEIFFGHSDKPLKLTKNYMVDPNDVELRETITTTENMQTKIGFIRNGKAYFMKMSNDNTRTSLENINVHDIDIRKSQCFIDLKSILLEAGFIDYDSLTETDTVYTNDGISIKLENKILIDKKGNTYRPEDVINLDDELDKASLIRLFVK